MNNLYPILNLTGILNNVSIAPYSNPQNFFGKDNSCADDILQGLTAINKGEKCKCCNSNMMIGFDFCIECGTN